MMLAMDWRWLFNISASVSGMLRLVWISWYVRHSVSMNWFTAGFAHWGLFLGHYEPVGNFRVADSKSYYFVFVIHTVLVFSNDLYIRIRFQEIRTIKYYLSTYKLRHLIKLSVRNNLSKLDTKTVREINSCKT